MVLKYFLYFFLIVYSVIADPCETPDFVDFNNVFLKIAAEGVGEIQVGYFLSSSLLML